MLEGILGSVGWFREIGRIFGTCFYSSRVLDIGLGFRRTILFYGDGGEIGSGGEW